MTWTGPQVGGTQEASGVSPNTSMEPLNRFQGSAENSIEAVSDQSVPVNLVSPPATESCHAQTTEEVAPFAIEF